jgi:CPA1 family monovalent cation:H+ antiporter
MDGLEVTVLLGASVLVGVLLAPRLRMATPLLLVVVGLALGFVPELREVQLPPETMLLVFLPVILFWESLTTSLRSIKRDLRGIVIASTLLVVATAFAVAGIAHLFGLPWEVALILGAAVAPPDATAVAALGRTLPRRNFMQLKAESLTNDGTALVVYAIAVGVAMGGSFTPLDITGMVLLSYLGGAAAGLAIAALAVLLLRRVRDPLSVNIALLVAPFAAFLAAELIHGSGVLAVVVAGLAVSYAGPRISTAASRRQTESAWPLGSAVLNGALFVLIGLEVQHIAHETDAAALGRLIVMTVAVWTVLLVVRFGVMSLSAYAIRMLDRRPSQRARRMTYRARVVSAVAGFRGAVSLAIALSVPTMAADGTPLAGRDDIIFVAAGVIVLTLLVQGPVLPAVVRWARLPEDDSEQAELRLAERAITDAALAAMDELAAEHGIDDETRARLLRDHEDHLVTTDGREQTDASGDAATPASGQAPDAVAAPPKQSRHEQYARLRLALLERKREVLLQLRRDGTLDDAVARRVQARLDVEELRLTGVEPIE